MKVAGDRTFDFPQQTVWEVLNDPARLAKGDANWGSYYANEPIVMAGKISHGLRVPLQA